MTPYAIADSIMGFLTRETWRIALYLVIGFFALWLIQCAWVLIFNVLGVKPRS